MKFTIPEQYNEYTLREIFQQLKLPKKVTSTEYVKRDKINEQQAKLTDKVVTGDEVIVPTPKEKVIIYLVIVTHKSIMKIMI